jgi:hypothetical protein
LRVSSNHFILRNQKFAGIYDAVYRCSGQHSATFGVWVHVGNQTSVTQKGYGGVLLLCRAVRHDRQQQAASYLR